MYQIQCFTSILIMPITHLKCEQMNKNRELFMPENLSTVLRIDRELGEDAVVTYLALRKALNKRNAKIMQEDDRDWVVISNKNIARIIDRDPFSITYNLTKLQKAGYVQKRVYSQPNKRDTCMYSLTEIPTLNGSKPFLAPQDPPESNVINGFFGKVVKLIKNKCGREN